MTRPSHLVPMYRSSDVEAWSIAMCGVSGPWWGEWLAWLAQDRTVHSLNGLVLSLPAQD